VRQPLLRPVVLALAALTLGSCRDDRQFTQPATAVYTTPTGLVTANPPQLISGAGDISECGNDNDEATAKLLDAIPGAVFTLGDNVMPNGTSSEFASCYDPTWGRHKARTRPAPGNHDYNTSGAAGYFAYFGAAAGEPGKGYYSYALGAWHVVVLNSNISSAAGSAQDTWLKADLAAHPNQCTLAYYHHPLYSSTGGTGTGGATLSGSRTFVNDLYAAHADLILNGHRHFYERLAPMRPDGTADPVNGVREIISGTGGDGGGTLTNIFPLSEVRNGSTFGVLKLWLYDDSYAWKFVPVAGKTFTDSGSTACHASGGGGGVSAAQSTISAAPSSFTAGSGAATITVTARDGNGSAIGGATVTVAASGFGNALTPASGTTDGNGVFVSSFTSTVAESKTLSATIDGTAIMQTATVTVNPSGGGGGGTIVPAVLTSDGSAANQKVYTTAAFAPAANALVTVAVRMRRSSGALTPTLSGGGMTSWAQVASVDYDPVATPTSRLVLFRAMSAAPGSGPLTITFPSSISNVEWMVVQWTGVDPSGTNGSGAIGQTGSANGNAATTLARALAPFGNANNVALGVLGAATSGPAAGPGPGFTELAESSSGESTLLEAEWGSNLNAVSATLSRSANAGLLAVELVAGGGSVPAVSASLSTVSAISPIAAGGTSAITVTVNDAGGQLLSGVAVTLAATGSNSITQPTGPTDADGRATGTLHGSVAGSSTITAVAGGVTLSQHPVVDVTAGPPDAGASTVSAAPATIVAGSGTSIVTVTVRDVFGNAVGGAAVSLSSGGTGVSLGTPSGFSNSSGVFTSTLSSTDPQQLIVTASVEGMAMTQTVGVTVTPAGGGSGGTIVEAVLTSGHDANNLRVYTTGSLAPAANALVTVAVLTHQASAAAPNPVLSGGGMAGWDVVGSVTFNGATPLDRLTIYRAMSAAPGSGPITITSSVTVSNCQWIVSQWTGVDESGANGAGAIVQTGQATGTAVNGLTATLAAFGSANDVGYGVFGVASATAVVTAGTGFSIIDQQPSGESTTGDLFAEWGLNQNAVGAAWTGKSGGALGVEIKARVPL
jgi:invasin-like protein/Big-like domain-containing protein